MSDEILQKPSEQKSDSTSLTFRSQDRVLYSVVGAYLLLVISVIGLSYDSYGFIEAGKAFGSFIPLLLLVGLLVTQICHHPRFSAVAFIMCVLIVLIQALVTLMLAGAASAAV